ncbi:MAG: xanthine dehydrogenase family protein molybdopterin-binding subunit [Kutzneria sp.]|nr:xanthine dehydrogenase family protein molybdopterin-binding subunit [Kutzneria sp.]
MPSEEEKDKGVSLTRRTERDGFRSTSSICRPADGGRLYLTADPRRGETYQQILSRYGHPVQSRGESAASAGGFSYGAVFVEVRVDPDLGEVRVSRVVGAYDPGRILNRRTARSQAIGGIIWGIGLALMERAETDRLLGRIVTSSLSTYLVPVEADVPDIDVSFVDRADSTSTALGARGIGEVTATGVSAAISNAVFHATGRRVRDLPITPDTLL